MTGTTMDQNSNNAARPEIRIMLPESSLGAPSVSSLPLDTIGQLVCQETCDYLTSLYPHFDVVVTHGRVAEPIVVAASGDLASRIAFEKEVRNALVAVPDVRTMSMEEIEERLERLHSWVRES